MAAEWLWCVGWSHTHRRTGGLRDTVFDVDDDGRRAAEAGVSPNGYSFDGTDESALEYALDRAIQKFYDDRAGFTELARTAMQVCVFVLG
jgi:starch synthase